MIYCPKRLLVGCLLLSACQTTGAQKVLQDYRSAVQRADAQEALRLSDPKTQQLWKELGKEPDAFRLSVEARSSTVAVAQRSELFLLEDGSVYVLSLVDGEWRVQGRLQPMPAASPEEALKIFVAAALALRLDVVRSFIPQARLQDYVSDSVLSAHLAQTRPRLVALRPILATLAPARRPDPSMAEIEWAPGHTATLRRESDGWKVLDLE